MRQTKRTKIVCTIGPASEEASVVRDMIRAGMNVARLNFSHGTYEHHTRLIETIRQASEESGEPVAILQDLQGPKIRVGLLPSEGVELKSGEAIVLTTEPDYAHDVAAGRDKVPVGYANLHDDVKPGDRLLLDDGLLDVKITGIANRDIACRVVTGGKLLSHKGINLPTSSLSTPAITDKDRADVRFGVSAGVDWVALSFVRTAKEVYDLRYLIRDCEQELGIKNERPTRILAKIEKHEAVRNIDDIIEAVDGIMVARGDLGIEMPPEEVPLIQKRIIDKCRAVGKPVIVATQMLDSMTRNPRPTRAEVSDVANAVIDRTDAVMLSGESASGKYPVEAVETMARIIREAEASEYDDVPAGTGCAVGADVENAIAGVASILSRNVRAKLILVASLSGDTGRVVSRFRPEMPILVATDDERVRRQLNLSWGVIPFVLPRCGSVEELVDRSTGWLKAQKLVKDGDDIILIAGEPVGASGGVNLVELKRIK